MALDSLKDAYYSLEDKIGRTGIIALVIAIIAVIAVVSFLLLVPSGEKKIELNILDAGGNPIEGIRLEYTINETTLAKTSDEGGKIVFNAPLNATVDISVSKQSVSGIEYDSYYDSIEASEDIFMDIELEISITSSERTLIMQSASGERITGKLITLRLACANGYAISPSTVTDADMDGEIKITQPSQCDALTAILTGPPEFKRKTIIINEDLETIALEDASTDVSKSLLKVKARDSETNDLLTSTSFTVTLRKPDGYKVDEKTTGMFGEASFADIAAGTYNITVLDSSGAYAITNISGTKIDAGEKKEITASMSKSIKRTLKISVIDKLSNAKVPNASVKLLDLEGVILAEENTGDPSAIVEFPILEESEFSLFVSQEEYLDETFSVGAEGENITVKIEKITSENSGRVKVKVIDDYGKKVEGAKVALRNAEDDFLASDYKISDYNGEVLFKGMKPGVYYAYASKEPVAFGNNKEDAAEIKIKELTEFIVQLIIGNATLRLSAVDIDENPINDVEAEIFSFDGKSLGKTALPQGSADFTLRADNKVYIVFKNPDYGTVQTMPKQLMTDQEFEFNAIMPARQISGGFKVEHEGIYNEAGEKTTLFNAGQKYLAVFKIIVPENSTISAIGLHYRVGDEKRIENEPLAVIDAEVGNPGAIIKGNSFNAPAGYSIDSTNLSEGDAKWIDIKMDIEETGNYYAGVWFRVKKTTLPSTLLTMHYRAWGLDGLNYIRYPFDEELGSSENTQKKQALYAKTIDNLRFYEGEAPDCSEEFCYSGEWIFDNLEGLYLNAPYEGILSADYNYHFIITNNSERAYENSELYIRNYTGDESREELKFNAYSIEDSAGKKISAQKTELDKIEKINLGNFFNGTSVSGNLLFRTKKTGMGQILLYIIADGRRVFEKIVDFKINSNKKLLISVEPETIPAFVENKLAVKIVQEKETGNLEVENALVTVKKTNPDKTTAFFSGKTNALGIAEFTIPASSPKTKLLFNAEKSGYYAEPLEKEISSEILLFDPASISTELNTRENKEEFFDEKITNKTGLDLALESIQPTGKLRRVLDTSTMLNYMQNFSGQKLAASDTTEIEKLLYVKLSPEIAKVLSQNTAMDGNFLVTVTEPSSGSKYDFKLPVHVGITLSDLPTEACISISKSEWLASTQGNTATLEFEVTNNCMVDETMLDLENLMAKITWNSNQLGSVELSMTDSETGETSIETLSTQWTKLFGRVRAGTSYSAFLTFTPKENALGKDALFSVEIDGQIMAAGGLKFVGAVPKAINSSIKIINLEQCLQYNDAEEIVKIDAGANEAVFSIDASNCGSTDMEIALCREDSGKCSGKAEGSIQLSKIQFSLNAEKASQEITVYREQIAGMYGIIVEAKVPGKAWQKVRIIDVFVEPNSDAILTMGKYSFVIKGIGSKDSAAVINTNVVEEVTIDASACDWGTAAEKAKENRDNGMGSMLPMMAIPLMMNTLPPLIDAMGNAGQGINQEKQQSTPKLQVDVDPLKTKVDDLVKQANDLSDLFKNFKEKNLKNVDDAMKKLDEKIDGLSTYLSDCSSDPTNTCTNVGVKTRVDNIKKARDLAKTDYAACKKDYYDAALNKFNSGKTALGDAQTGVNNYNKTIVSIADKYKPFTPNGASSSSTPNANYATAAEAARKSISPINDNLIKCVGDCKFSLDKLMQGADGKNFQDCLKGVKEKFEGVSTLAKLLNDSINDSTCTVTLSKDQTTVPLKIACTGLLQELSAKSEDNGVLARITKTNQEIDTALGDKGLTPLKDGLEKIVNGIGDPNNLVDGTALKMLDTVKNDATKAIQDRLDAANAMKPVEDAAKAARTNSQLGPALTNLAMQAAMMGMMGAMMGGANDAGNDTDPCNDRVQQQVTAWVVNLEDGTGPVATDKVGIGAYWNLEDMKMTGQYEKQEAAVVFENQGIQEPDPVYATVTMKVKQTMHSPTVRMPTIGNMGGISGGMLQMATTGFMGPSPVPGTTTLVSQKYHLKFTTMDFVQALPPAITEKTCLQGTMIGTTGEEALPKIKLSWDWADTSISADECVESEEGIYCDATQFSIMLSKRLKKLQEFVEKNSSMRCPLNPGAEAIQEMTKNYNQYLIELGLEPLPANMQAAIDCWVPKSTIDIGSLSGTASKTAIEYYIEENEDSIEWTNDIKSIEDLRELLNFKAFLIKDNYNDSFKTDFADYYTKKSLLNAPEWFTNSPSGRFADYFYDNEKLSFTRKSLDSTELLAPGIYETELKIGFGDNWQFFKEGKPSAKIIAVFNYLQEPYPNNVFYYLPFNANIGKESGEGRNGYGINYENETEPFTITGTGTDVVSTSTSSGTGTITLNSAISRDPKLLNSIASRRGMLLNVSIDKINNASLVFSPNYATPVTMKMHSEITQDNFGAFYELRQAGTPMQTGAHLAFWNAAGECYDFTGVPLTDRFDFAADRQASSSDPINNWQFAYGIDWDRADKAGDVYLRTVFYTPTGKQYLLSSVYPNSLVFETPDSELKQNIDLSGISTMQHNNQKTGGSTNSLQELFEMVKSEEACVTNTGSEAVFWWNPSVLYETTGSIASQKTIDESIACIKG